MNSAAVIGRQLRQQNTGRGQPQSGKGRPRASSQQPTLQQQQQLQKAKDDEKEKVGCIQNIRNKVTIQCLWLTFKAFSGGFILLIIGTTMSVVGFYADSLSTEMVDSGNSTAEVTDEERHYHLHNLTYVGPVFMGLGGFVIVAAFVMTFEGHDSHAKVVPMKDDRSKADGSLLTSLLVDDHLSKDKQNGPSTSGPYLCVPQAYDVPVDLRRQSVTLANNGKVNTSKVSTSKVSPTTAKGKAVAKQDSTKVKNEPEIVKGAKKKDSQVFQVLPPNGPNKEIRPPPSLSLAKREMPTTSDIQMKKRERMMMQLCLGDFVPSPQDIEIIDPDGCDTPLRNSRASSSMDMEVYVSNCPITVRVQVEPRHLASMESDGLSDSDISDPGELARISRKDFDFPEQEMPLLGRCSPAFSSPEQRRSEHQLFKRDNNRRFPLLKQGALDTAKTMGNQNQVTLT